MAEAQNPYGQWIPYQWTPRPQQTPSGPTPEQIAAQLKQEQDAANAANEQRYQQILALNDQTRGRVMEGLNTGYASLLGMAGNVDPQLERERRRLASETGSLNQSAVDRGIMNTTVLDNLRRGVVDDSALRESEIMQQGNREKMGIMSNQMQDIAGAERDFYGSRAGVMERRTDAGPDTNLYMQLMSQARGNYDLGPMPPQMIYQPNPNYPGAGGNGAGTSAPAPAAGGSGAGASTSGTKATAAAKVQKAVGAGGAYGIPLAGPANANGVMQSNAAQILALEKMLSQARSQGANAANASRNTFGGNLRGQVSAAQPGRATAPQQQQPQQTGNRYTPQPYSPGGAYGGGYGGQQAATPASRPAATATAAKGFGGHARGSAAELAAWNQYAMANQGGLLKGAMNNLGEKAQAYHGQTLQRAAGIIGGGQQQRERNPYSQLFGNRQRSPYGGGGGGYGNYGGGGYSSGGYSMDRVNRDQADRDAYERNRPQQDPYAMLGRMA